MLCEQVQALTDELERSQDAAQAQEDQLRAELANAQRQVQTCSPVSWPDQLHFLVILHPTCFAIPMFWGSFCREHFPDTLHVVLFCRVSKS